LAVTPFPDGPFYNLGMKKLALVTLLVGPVFLLVPAPCRAAEPVKVIFDTDMDSDCDDVGALAVLHALADRREVEILATVVSSRHEWSPACVAAINTYYGRPDLPVGRPAKAGAMKPSRYARAIAERFPHRLGPVEQVPDALAVYRRVLSAQADGSVVIVTVGYLTNIAGLLQLPAAGTEPGGLDLVKRKVKRWVCMGGNFVGRPAVDDLKLGNNNFTYDRTAALYAVRNWPVELRFVGREIGSVPSGLQAGARLRDLPQDNPIRAAYALWFGGEPKDRHVADQTTVLFAVRGLRDYWEVETEGWMDLQPDMTFRWRQDRERKQGYLLKRQVDGEPNDRAIEKVIEDLMLQRPAGKPG
jgi:hypothetical protein